MKDKFTIHLVTQDDQPIGSRRKCCEKCGKAIHAMNPDIEGYVDNLDSYTEQNAKEYNSIRCVDKS